MTNMEMIFILLFFIGFFIAALAATKKLNAIPGGAAMGVTVGVALIVAGGIWGIMPVLPEADTTADDTGGTIIIDSGDAQYPTFDITPSAVTTAGTYCEDTTLNTAKTVFTVPAWGNTSSDTIIHRDNSTAWQDPRLQFQVVPVPYAGADADDLATIYFEVDNYDVIVDVADATNERLITKTSGEYQVIWTEGSNTWYVDGSKTMLLTGNVTLYVDFDVNQAGFANIPENDSVDLTVTFHNGDWSWSKSYTVTFMIQYAWSW
jgi:hypothetical protein